MKSVLKKRIFSVCVCISFLPQLLQAQLPERPALEDTGPLPWFYILGTTSLDADSAATELLVQTKITYDHLVFVKADSFYLAKYELGCGVFNEDDVLEGSRTLRKQVKQIGAR